MAEKKKTQRKSFFANGLNTTPREFANAASNMAIFSRQESSSYASGAGNS
jgi:hypothetical protein